jgi:P27 family predicted phage terminase small subunit
VNHVPAHRKDLATHLLQNTKPKYVEPSSDVAPGRPKFPKGISADAKKVFKRLCALLEERRVLTSGDSELLRLYAVTFTRHEQALEKLAEQGCIREYVRLDSNGQPHQQEKPNLWLDVAQNCEKFMRATLSDLGLNPTQRSKVKQVQPKPEANAAEAAMFSRDAEQPLIDDEPDLSKIDETLIQ